MLHGNCVLILGCLGEEFRVFYGNITLDIISLVANVEKEFWFNTEVQVMTCYLWQSRYEACLYQCACELDI